MGVGVRFRDAFAKYTPRWLADRPGQQNGPTFGYRTLWAMIAPLDVLADVAVQGLQAGLGIGTPTALPLIGRSRGLLRWQDESDAAYAARLRGWLDAWRAAGSMEVIARQIQGYMRSTPYQIRVWNRAGFTGTLTGSSWTTGMQAWSWDEDSNPERSFYWSELFIVVQTSSQWAFAGAWGSGTWGDAPLGLGHDVTTEESDAIRGLVNQWKAAHTYVRVIVWCSDSSKFDPLANTGASGAWGQWSDNSGQPSERNKVYANGPTALDVCRFWEFPQ